MPKEQKWNKQERPQRKREKQDEHLASPSLLDKKKKLKELDKLIENVLTEAGEEFLDNFKQVEGQ